MAKYYGDIPCAKIGNEIHITVNSTSCLCGKSYIYGKPTNRNDLSSSNIIWRELEAVSCKDCKKKYKHYNSAIKDILNELDKLKEELKGESENE